MPAGERVNATKRETYENVISGILAGIVVVIISYAFGLINFDLNYGHGSSTIIFASLGVSAYLLNAAPKSKYAKIESVIFAYVICAVAGFMAASAISYTGTPIASGFAVAATAIIMGIAGRIHPPAIGYALAFVLYDMSLNGVAIVLILGFLVIAVSLVLRYLLYKALGWKFNINFS